MAARVGLAAVVVAAGTLALPTVAHAAPAPELAADSNGSPLFGGGTLKPGGAQENCVVLSYKHLQTETTNGVGTYAALAGTGLADYLLLTISAGTGGRYGNCSGFVGSTVYSGSLAAFGAAHNAPANQLPVSMVSGANGDLSIRVRLALQDVNAAQGKTADAAFSWTVGPMSPPPPPAPSSVSPPASPSPASLAIADVPGRPATAEEPLSTEPQQDSAPAGEPVVDKAVDAVTPSVAGISETAEPSPAALPAAGKITGPPSGTVTVPLLPTPGLQPTIDSAAPTGGGPVGSGAAPAEPAARPRVGTAAPAGPATQLRGAITRLVTSAQEAATAAAEAAPTAARGGALGLAALPFVLLFLVVQKRLDERDPKLAFAPSHEYEFLHFDDDVSPVELVAS